MEPTQEVREEQHMIAKLREYRRYRREQKQLEKEHKAVKNGQRSFLNLYSRYLSSKPMEQKVEKEKLIPEREKMEVARMVNENFKRREEKLIQMEEVTTKKAEKPVSWKYCIFKWTAYTVVWLALYAFFLMWQFGAVFFAVSLLVGIYVNTRTEPKQVGEVSAYSVFNENFETIKGTITPETLQRNMGFGGIRLI